MARLLSVAMGLVLLTLPMRVEAQVTLANADVEAAASTAEIAAVIAVAERLDRALVSVDRSIFAATMAPDPVVNNPQNGFSLPGAAISRNAAGAISCGSYGRSIEYAGMRGPYVLLMEEEVVVARGTTARVHRRFTDLWGPAEGGWRLTARQATVIVPR